MAETLHLIKRGDMWVYFRRVPKHLVAAIGRQFIKRSLGVTDRTEAKKLRAIEDVKTDALFEQAEKGLLADASQPISIEALTEFVRAKVAKLDKRSADRLLSNPPADADALAERRDTAEHDLRTLENRFDPNTMQATQATAREIADTGKLDLNGAAFPVEAFFELVRRGLVEAGQRRLDRLEGRHGAVHHDALFDPKREPADITLADLSKVFVAEKEADHKANRISAKRTDKIKAAIDTLREIVGDKTPVHTIDDDMVQRVRTMIAAMPTNRTKVYGKLKLEKAIERAAKDGKPTLSPVTQAVYLDVFRDALKVAVRKKHLASNPAADIKPIVREVLSSAHRREPWTPEQLKGFFEGQFYRSLAAGVPYKKPDLAWRKWLPLLMLFSGARPNELCSLRTADVLKTPAGTWYFAVTDEGEGKTIKTAASKRRVPIHPELVKMGFLSFVDGRRADKSGMLFHELKPNTFGNRAWYAAKRLNETFIPAEITLSARQSLYSLRHCVRDAMRRSKATPEALLHITGWSPAGKAVSDDYGDRGDPDLHAEAVTAISYPGLDLSYLHVK